MLLFTVNLLKQSYYIRNSKKKKILSIFIFIYILICKFWQDIKTYECSLTYNFHNNNENISTVQY